MREDIIQEFCKRETHLRIIIATNAFGLGVDCADISKVIHWGPPSTLEELAQETGRAGRNGCPSDAILYYKKCGESVSNAMQIYGEIPELVVALFCFKISSLLEVTLNI